MNSRPYTERAIALLVCGCICFTAGCVRSGRSAQPQGTVAPTGINEETANAMLHSKINALIRTANDHHESGEKELRDAPPYFFCGSEYFPEGPGQFRATMRRAAGNRPHFEASVTIAAHRYTTRYHLSRVAAARDRAFIREEGLMHYTFALSGAQWVHTYSYFEPAVVKMFDGNEWTEVPFVADRFVEDKPSFWGRLFGFIF